MARNPYEIRLELLQLAENRLLNRYQEEKERYQYLDEKGDDPGQYPEFPSDADIDQLAKRLIATMSGE
tara:strand:+ start:676 stop:879 length:204 start_codon:yes stop_codon:yes gene_type:complete